MGRHAPTHPASEAADDKRWWGLGVICVAMFISAMDMTIVNVALPDMSEDLDAGMGELQWVLDAFLVTLAGLLLVGNGLADRFGRRRVFVLGLVGFAVTSVLAALAATVGQLIAARVLMGWRDALMGGSRRRVLVKYGVPIAVAVGLLAFPFPYRVKGDATMRPVKTEYVAALTSGRLMEVHAREGDRPDRQPLQPGLLCVSRRVGKSASDESSSREVECQEPRANGQ